MWSWYSLAASMVTVQLCAAWLAFQKDQQNRQVCYWCPFLFTEESRLSVSTRDRQERALKGCGTHYVVLLIPSFLNLHPSSTELNRVLCFYCFFWRCYLHTTLWECGFPPSMNSHLFFLSSCWLWHHFFCESLRLELIWQITLAFSRSLKCTEIRFDPVLMCHCVRAPTLTDPGTFLQETVWFWKPNCQCPPSSSSTSVPNRKLCQTRLVPTQHNVV